MVDLKPMTEDILVESPDGSVWRITVDNSGVLTTIKIYDGPSQSYV